VLVLARDELEAADNPALVPPQVVAENLRADLAAAIIGDIEQSLVKVGMAPALEGAHVFGRLLDLAGRLQR
jgi:hypothetical protein